MEDTTRKTLSSYTNQAQDVVQVNISNSISPPPEEHEISAAWIIARHYKCRIVFLKPRDGYKIKTPDFIMKALEWEIKSPTGKAKRTIRNNIDLAKVQSENIVIDTRRTSIADELIERELKKQCKIKTRISRLIMITKNEKVLEIKWR